MISNLKKSVRILIADDCSVTRKAIRNTIKHEVEDEYVIIEEAPDGRIALDRLKRRSYNIVFLDINMPHLNGTEVIAAAKNLDESTIIVPMSTEMNDKQRDLFKSKHAYHFLKKPFNKKAPINIVRSHVIMEREYSILVVDDSSTQRKIARRILEGSRFKFHIREAESAAAAFHQIAAKAPHIILTDFHMPDVDGIEFAGRIREITTKIKVYMMTTDKALYVERSAAFVGTAGFLQKPFTPDDIDTLMHKFTNVPIPSFGKKRNTFSFLKKDETVPEPTLVPLDEQNEKIARPRVIEKEDVPASGAETPQPEAPATIVI